VLLKALVRDLLLHNDQVLILDLEAGLEHLGRATAGGVDTLLVVVEPGQRSVDCARRIATMGRQIGLADIRFVANKITGPRDEQFIREAMADVPPMAMIPYSELIRTADRSGDSVLDCCGPEAKAAFAAILAGLEKPQKTEMQPV
jgi:CO dehydrogenase maturation factor